MLTTMRKTLHQQMWPTALAAFPAFPPLRPTFSHFFFAVPHIYTSINTYIHKIKWTKSWKKHKFSRQSSSAGFSKVPPLWGLVSTRNRGSDSRRRCGGWVSRFLIYGWQSLDKHKRTYIRINVHTLAKC